MSENNRGIIKKEKHKTSPTIQRTHHLLIIGIDTYKNGITPLNNAVRDAENFKDLLLQQYQFSEENITALFNEKATSINIRRTFSEILKKLTDTDNLIFYYSGHGEQLPYGKEKRGYWIPYDAELGEDYTYIPNEEITLLFKNSRAHHVFGIVDSCFSGSLFQNRNLTNATEKMNSYPSRWLLTAGRLEPVSDGSLGANSPFSTALLTYLKNNPADDLWVSDLCNQVLKGMNFNTDKQTPRGEALQGVGHYGGQFVFYKKGVTPEYVNELRLEDMTLKTTSTTTNLDYQSTKGEKISLNLQQLEQSGLKTQAELLIKKINRIKEGLI